jgi:hypothetical protein
VVLSDRLDLSRTPFYMNFLPVVVEVTFSTLGLLEQYRILELDLLEYGCRIFYLIYSNTKIMSLVFVCCSTLL